MTWKSQLDIGRVFELRSRSTKYPPPCGLILNLPAPGRTYVDRFMVAVDGLGCIGDGLYRQSHNPDIYVGGIRPEEFTSRRIARRRPDLERFDADDIALIRYGHNLDFDGTIHSYSMPSIPLTALAEWTVFWTPPYTDGFLYFRPNERERKAMAGAWHFSHHGGPKHLGYNYGHVVATRSTGARLERVRRIVLRYLSDMIETAVHVVRYTDEHGRTCVTTEFEGECAPFGDGRTTIYPDAKDGEYSMCCGPRKERT
jgi:hypothetical protein